MSSIQCFQNLEKLNDLIKDAKTGTEVDLAKKLAVSPNTVNDYLSMMRSMNAPIGYNPQENTYCYLKEWEFKIQDFMTTYM